MAYELWEVQGGNIIADFPTREKALDAVRVELHAGGKIDSWLLVYERDDGESVHIAGGDSLTQLALEGSKAAG
jgi:hypothetical protein